MRHQFVPVPVNAEDEQATCLCGWTGSYGWQESMFTRSQWAQHMIEVGEVHTAPEVVRPCGYQLPGQRRLTCELPAGHSARFPHGTRHKPEPSAGLQAALDEAMNLPPEQLGYTVEDFGGGGDTFAVVESFRSDLLNWVQTRAKEQAS